MVKIIQLSDMFEPFGYQTRPLTECLLYLPISTFFQIYVIASMLARASRSYAGGHAHGEHETHLVLAYINHVKARIESELVSFCIFKGLLSRDKS